MKKENRRSLIVIVVLLATFSCLVTGNNILNNRFDRIIPNLCFGIPTWLVIMLVIWGAVRLVRMAIGK